MFKFGTITLVLTCTSICSIASSPAYSEPLPINIEGEASPSFPDTNREILERYSQGNIEFITFHHQGYAGGNRARYNELKSGQNRLRIGQRMQNIHSGHKQRWGMYAYHYAIDHRGHIGKGRPIRYKPATGTNFDFNGHFAVVALGDYDFETLNSASRNALVKVMSSAQRKYKVHPNNIHPHMHHVGTSCPGRYIHGERHRLVGMTLNYSIQAELSNRGCNPGLKDGFAGRQTRAAFNRFISSNRNNFESRGMTGEALMEMLNQESLRCN